MKCTYRSFFKFAFTDEEVYACEAPEEIRASCVNYSANLKACVVKE